MRVSTYRFAWESRVYKIGVSIGVVAIDETIHTAGEVFSNADSACYAAKDRGRNRIYVHMADDTELKLQRDNLHWVSDINDAMENDRLRLHMQKIQPIDGHSDVYWEVLLRMLSRNGRLLLPGAFIPAAERYLLMPRVDEWVVETLLKTLHEYRLSGSNEEHPVIHVNLSGTSFTDTRVVDFVVNCLGQYQINPGKMVFELTETAAIANLATTKNFIAEVKSAGCRVALDDFGAGMNSYHYIKDLDQDFIKIDGLFIRDLATSELSNAIVRSMVDISRTIEVRSMEEFVENKAILDKLKELDVNYAQGFGIGKPISMEEFLHETWSDLQDTDSDHLYQPNHVLDE